MYLKELKAYKAPPVKPSDAEGHVHKFSIPKPPPSPEEADLAASLGEYEAQVPEVEGQSAGEQGAKVEEDWFEEPEEDEEPAHH
jgi:F-type H+-transporting ATPase subunit h